MDRNMNNLLRWSIENTAVPETNGTTTNGTSATGITLPAAPADTTTTTTTNGTSSPSVAERSALSPNYDALRALLGGPSEADLMREAMAAIVSPEASFENKEIAWENLELMVQNLDNANNLEPLAMWPTLVKELEGIGRVMAAWTIGTAVQNNEKTQEKLLSYGGYKPLVHMAIEDEDLTARKKAIYALSSGIRNFQPGLDEFLKLVPAEYKPDGAVEAGDMEAIDKIITLLREKAQQS